MLIDRLTNPVQHLQDSQEKTTVTRTPCPTLTLESFHMHYHTGIIKHSMSLLNQSAAVECELSKPADQGRCKPSVVTKITHTRTHKPVCYLSAPQVILSLKQQGEVALQKNNGLNGLPCLVNNWQSSRDYTYGGSFVCVIYC